ncbi:hypothetical protein ACQ86N_36830 [Puia sp. P3]|uniref:hypothetical protein n=1 Tax=Puia sp. P3 TaxID=3423952 RepID=UPI003D669C5B
MTALLIFGRKLYLQEPLNFLLTICLLSFFKGILELTYPLTRENQYVIGKLFTLALLLLLVPCFRPDFNGRSRYMLDLSLSALVSFAITALFFTGWEKPNPAIDAILNVYMALLILTSLPLIIRNGALQVLQCAPLLYRSRYPFLYPAVFITGSHRVLLPARLKRPRPGQTPVRPAGRRSQVPVLCRRRGAHTAISGTFSGTISLPLVRAFISSTLTPGARSINRKPSGVMSSTARSVTIFFTHFTPVNGRMQAGNNLGSPSG